MTYSSCSGSCGYSGNSSGRSCSYSSSSGLDAAYSSQKYSIDSVVSYTSENVGNIYSLEAASRPSVSVNTARDLAGTAACAITSAIRDAAYSDSDADKANSYSANPSSSVPKNYFSPETFLKPNRQLAKFIGKGEDIRQYVEEIFEKVMEKEKSGRKQKFQKFPEDIVISVVSKDVLREKHGEFGGRWNENIQGFSINRKGFSESLIIVKEDSLDRLLITIGHEIGHVLGFTLGSARNEEAKAFAFEMEWINAIYENDIAGLKENINLDPRPAENGLHDVAFNFVRKLLLSGDEAIGIYNDMADGLLTITGESE